MCPGRCAIGDVADDTADQTAAESDLALREGLEIGLRSTTLAGLAGPSEVDPDEPGSGRLVSIESVTPGQEVTLTWRQTLERDLTPEATETVGVSEDSPTPRPRSSNSPGGSRRTGSTTPIDRSSPCTGTPAR